MAAEIAQPTWERNRGEPLHPALLVALLASSVVGALLTGQRLLLLIGVVPLVLFLVGSSVRRVRRS